MTLLQICERWPLLLLMLCLGLNTGWLAWEAR
jgi:hypothetical protein